MPRSPSAAHRRQPDSTPCVRLTTPCVQLTTPCVHLTTPTIIILTIVLVVALVLVLTRSIWPITQPAINIPEPYPHCALARLSVDCVYLTTQGRGEAQVICIDCAGGNVRWRVAATVGGHSAPAVDTRVGQSGEGEVDGNAYLAKGVAVGATDGTLLVLDAADGRTRAEARMCRSVYC